MSLPLYIPLLALVLIWTWVQLRRAGERLRRIEWRVQEWERRAQECTPPQPLSFTRQVTDEEYAQLCADWRREHGQGAA